MRSAVKKIPNEMFFEYVLERISAGENVTIMVSGHSMNPTFRDGVDRIVLSPFDPSALAVGDVVLFDRGDQLCVHRIIERKGDALVIRGDGNAVKALERAKLSDVKALVTGGTMRGGRPFSISDKQWKDNTQMVFDHFPLLAFWHRLKSIVRRYPLSIMVSVLMLYLSFFNPGEKQLPNILYIDKIIHALMYAWVCITYWFEWLKNHRNSSPAIKKGLLCCLLFPILLGGLTEIGQDLFTTSRSGEWLDFAADVAGSLLAAILNFTVLLPLMKCYGKRKLAK